MFIKFSFFSSELNKQVTQVNIFSSVEAALAYAQKCGSNTTAEVWDGELNY